MQRRKAAITENKVLRSPKNAASTQSAAKTLLLA